MPNEPSSTDNFVQIDDRVINKVADATDTTDNITLDDRVLIFKENENKQVDKVCNATVSWLVDKFAEEATKAKNDAITAKNDAVSAQQASESAKADAITAKNDAQAIKNDMQNSLDSAIESAVGSVVITADATVNGTTGTPSVTVTPSGANTNRKFSFAFSGLKGEKGDAGEQGPQGPQGETGPQGPQGEKGDSPTIPTASSSVAGIMKLFTSLGQNTDGAPTNKAVQDAISAISLSMHPAGTVIWYSGKSLPSGYLVCNGQSLNKTTYANLFNAIGYTYGGSGNNFNVPNLSDGNGRFIRATTDFSKVGTKQDDAIRNITGKITYALNWNQCHYIQSATNLFDCTQESNNKLAGGSWGGLSTTSFSVDASKVVNTAAENRPYNIAFIALIAY